MANDDVKCLLLCNQRTYRERLSTRFEIKDVLIAEHLVDDTAVVIPEEAFIRLIDTVGEFYDYKEK